MRVSRLRMVVLLLELVADDIRIWLLAVTRCRCYLWCSRRIVTSVAVDRVVLSDDAGLALVRCLVWRLMTISVRRA